MMKIITKGVIKTAIKFLGRNDSKRLATLHVHPELKVIKDISYIDDGKKEHFFDLHLPIEDNGYTIIQIHGGGYIYSYKENNFFYSQEFAKRGYKVINTNYTLSNGETSVKTVINELSKLIDFVIDNSKEFNIDLNKLVIMGDSAGGHLALLLALTINHEDVAANLGITFKNKVHVNKVVLASPIYDYVYVCEQFKKGATKRALQFLVGEDFKDENYPFATCPRYIINKDIDKYLNFDLFVSSCDDDFIKGQTLKMKNDLKDKIDLYYPKDAKTKLEHIFPIICPHTFEANECNDLIDKFIKK